jgi:hypothetical protein
MPDLTAKRTLVKSPPELWEELSEVEGLAKHLGAFGEIKITKLEPEHTVAWEGEHASGTVSIEPSGWGTKVTLHAELPEDEAPIAEEPIAEDPPVAAEEPSAEAEEPEPLADAERPVADVEEPEPVADEPQAAPRRRGFWGWLFRTRTGGQDVEPEQVAIEPEPEPVVEEPEPVAVEPEPEPVVEKPEPVVEETEPEPAAAEVDSDDEAAVDPERARAILDDALDALGAAHHRPFSRG